MSYKIAGKARILWLALFLLAAGVFVALSYDGRMYWHEGRLLYAVTHFSIGELINGYFNPHQLGTEINLASTSGFHLTKILHLQLLSLLTSVPVTTDTQVMIGSVASILAIAGCGLCVRGILREIGLTYGAANWAVVAFFLMPSIPYVAGKLLAEVTALLPAFVALWLWSQCLKTGLKASFAKSILVAVLIAVTALARLDIIIAHLGFAVATAFVAHTDARAQLLRLHAFVCCFAGLLYVIVIASIGGNFSDIPAYLSNFLSLHPKSLPMSIFGLATFGGLMWIFMLAGIGVKTEQRPLLLIWLLICLVPIAGIVVNYMIEPRYLVATAMPFSALAGISLHRFFSSLQSGAVRKTAFVMVAIVAVANALPIALMPYEIDRKSILIIADTYVSADSDSSLLVSWSYTDFHFLRYARPNANIFNVHSPQGSRQVLTKEWDTRVRSWYGGRLVTNEQELAILKTGGPVYYLGWGVYPPVETLTSWTTQLGMGAISASLYDLPLLVHEEQSWLWSDSQHVLKPVGSYGQYNVYELDPTRR